MRVARAPAGAIPQPRQTGRAPLQLAFSWPGGGPAGESDNFIIGAWCPDGPLTVSFRDAPPGIVREAGANWMLASAGSPLHAPGTGLVHASADGEAAVAFRGYVLPSLHAYAPADDILSYWAKHADAEHNGVFSAAMIEDDGARCSLIVDGFGFGPMYYREVGRAIVFSTNPRYLATDGDTPDRLAWRCFVETGWVQSDRSLSDGISRVPAGSVVRFSADGPRTVAWFPFDSLPAGTETVGTDSVADVEHALREAVDRCLGLAAGDVVLPLSSGFDSRRILTALHARNVAFEAVSARVFNRGGRDLDARFAAELARDFGFPLTVAEPPSVEQFVVDDHVRRALLDSHSTDHTWAVGLMRQLPERPCVVFDGIAGDVLGDPVGWLAHARMPVEERPLDQEAAALANVAITDVFDSTLNPSAWPSAADVRRDLRSYLQRFAPRNNLAELTFLLLRQRRAIAVWSQQLLPPGHTVVCPYLDLDYVRLLLSFTSTSKHATSFQRACLAAFWPQFHRYPGTRDVPDWVEPRSVSFDHARIAARHRALRAEIHAHHGAAELHELLRVRKRVVLALSRFNPTIAARAAWYLTPIMELVARQRTARACWTADG